MPNYIRPRARGATIFFTVSTARRGSDVLCGNIALLREAVRQTHRELPFESRAWVILPDHLHAIWTLPPGDGDFARRWGAIKARFSMAMRRAGFTPPPPVGMQNGGVNPALRRKGEVGLWQPRFWEHHIRDRADLDTHLRYCWLNPVRHGLVDSATDWPFSSLHRDLALGMAAPVWARIDGEFGE